MACVKDAAKAENCTNGEWIESQKVCVDPMKSKINEGCSEGFTMRTCQDLTQAQCSAAGLAGSPLYNGAAGKRLLVLVYLLYAFTYTS